MKSYEEMTKEELLKEKGRIGSGIQKIPAERLKT